MLVIAPINRRNIKPQTSQLTSGLFLMICSGLHLGWGLVIPSVLTSPWTSNYTREAAYVVLILYFVSAFLGLMTAAYVHRQVSTRSIYFVGCGISIISSILFVALPSEYFSILFARILAGFTHGLVYPIIIIQCSEIAMPNIRGASLALIHICIILGLFVVSMFELMKTDIREEFANVNFLLGLMALICGLISATPNYFTKVSPVQYLVEKKEAKALKVMLFLNAESRETNSIRNEFNELRAMVEEDETSSYKMLADGNLSPLILVLLMKIAYVLSFNLLLNLSRYSSTNMFVVQRTSQDFVILAAFFIRLSTSLITLCSIDALGRRKLFLISSGGASLTLFVFGIFGAAYWNSTANGTLLIIFEIFCGLGVGITADVYSGEAFGTFKKGKSIAFVTTIEYFLQICIILIAVPITRTTVSITSFVCSIFMLAITVYLYFMLPETAKKSIRQTRNEFKRQEGAYLFWK